MAKTSDIRDSKMADGGYIRTKFVAKLLGCHPKTVTRANYEFIEHGAVRYVLWTDVLSKVSQDVRSVLSIPEDVKSAIYKATHEFQMDSEGNFIPEATFKCSKCYAVLPKHKDDCQAHKVALHFAAKFPDVTSVAEDVYDATQATAPADYNGVTDLQVEDTRVCEICTETGTHATWCKYHFLNKNLNIATPKPEQSINEFCLECKHATNKHLLWCSKSAMSKSKNSIDKAKGLLSEVKAKSDIPPVLSVDSTLQEEPVLTLAIVEGQINVKTHPSDPAGICTVCYHANTFHVAGRCCFAAGTVAACQRCK